MGSTPLEGTPTAG